MILLSAGRAGAEPDALKPATTHRGWQLDLTGYLQADAVAWSQDSVDELAPGTGQPLNEERFVIPRARLRAEARKDALALSIDLDGNTRDGATARLLAAQASYTFRYAGEPLVVASAGLFKIPFGAEVPALERDKPFLEPPAMSRALFPGNYDAGALLEGRYGLARWALAITNGAPAGDAQWKGRDPSASYDFVGRVGADIAAPYQLRFELGVSALTGAGLHPGTTPTKDDIQWVDDNQNGRVDPTEIVVIPGTPGQPSERYTHSALGGDATVHWCICKLGNGAAFVEAAIATNLDRGLVYADPVAAGRDLRQLGFAAGVVQDLGAHATVGVRYDRYDADRDAMEQEGEAVVTTHQIFSTLGIMASAHWHDARLIVEYDRARNPFGRGDDGAPASRAADRLTLRAQVGF